MNDKLFEQVMKLIRGSVESNIKLFDKRVEKKGKKATTRLFAQHCGACLNALFDEAEITGAPSSVSAIEAAIALTAALYLDLADHSADIEFSPDGEFLISSEGEPWIEGNLDAHTS